MLEMLVVDRKMGMIWLVTAIRIRSSAYAIRRPCCHSRGCVRWGMAIQAVVWWWLGVLLRVTILIHVRSIIP
jgi:hypothetical protein